MNFQNGIDRTPLKISGVLCICIKGKMLLFLILPGENNKKGNWVFPSRNIIQIFNLV